jgi:hypothetical protein
MRRHYRPLFLRPVPVWSKTEPVEGIGEKEQRQGQTSGE